jgi:RNA polymerase-binding transcription factor DksA
VICDEHIADDRLEAMPATRYCITHASGRASTHHQKTRSVHSPGRL